MILMIQIYLSFYDDDECESFDLILLFSQFYLKLNLNQFHFKIKK